jgi:hypothetical protein
MYNCLLLILHNKYKLRVGHLSILINIQHVNSSLSLIHLNINKYESEITYLIPSKTCYYYGQHFIWNVSFDDIAFNFAKNSFSKITLYGQELGMYAHWIWTPISKYCVCEMYIYSHFLYKCMYPHEYYLFWQ